VGEHEHAGAVRGLDAAGDHARRARQRRLLVGLAATERKLGRPRVVAHRSEVAGRVEHVRKYLGWDAESLAQPGVEPGLAQRVELGTRRGRLIGGEAGPQPVAEEGVHRAHAEGPGVAGGRHALIVLQQPGHLRGREVGIGWQAGPRLDRLLVVGHPVEDLL
jgi:hypothetical protein